MAYCVADLQEGRTEICTEFGAQVFLSHSLGVVNIVRIRSRVRLIQNVSQRTFIVSFLSHPLSISPIQSLPLSHSLFLLFAEEQYRIVVGRSCGSEVFPFSAAAVGGIALHGN